ncbi:MAG: leucine-rich repeat domain-containing protein [Saprospiraceae bacterium]
MSAHNITIAFHGADAQHRIFPLELDEAFQLKTKTHQVWKERVAEICRICKAKDLDIALVYEKDPAQKWLHILLMDMEQLKSNRFLDQIPGSDLRPVESPEERGYKLEDKNKGRYDPLITISSKDFLDFNTKARAEELADKRKRDLHDQNLDTRAKFLDSSIWHRYVPEMPGPSSDAPGSETPTFQIFFEEVLDEMMGHWREGLYYTVAAVTTLEFQLRMLRHSFIGQFGDGGHAGVVTPFKFHSERHLQRRTELREDNFLTKKHNGQNLLSAIQWRMLLVDDYANEALSTIGKGYGCTTKKHELVRRPLDRLYQSHGIDAFAQFELVSPEAKQGVLDFCASALCQRTFDVIFLDYLLGERPEASASPKNREYGYELLLRLIEDSRKADSQYHRDFFGRYWIFPVSSFPFALSDKLVQLGIGHLHSIWHLSGGGDPVTTPHLYAFYLFRFLKQKVGEYYLYPKALQRLLNEIPNFPNTGQGKRLWAKCLRAALSHYRSRLEVVSQSASDGTQSPFLQSIEDFVTQRIRIKILLNAILKDTEKIAEGDLQAQEVKQRATKLRHLVSTDFKDYYDCLQGLFTKIESFANAEMDKALQRIEAARIRKDTSLDLSGLDIQRLPDQLTDVLPDLKNLDLSNTGLREVPSELSKLNSLVNLNLAKNKITQHDSLKHLAGLTELNDLDLTGNPFQPPIDILHRRNRQAVINLFESLFGQGGKS